MFSLSRALWVLFVALAISACIASCTRLVLAMAWFDCGSALVALVLLLAQLSRRLPPQNLLAVLLILLCAERALIPWCVPGWPAAGPEPGLSQTELWIAAGISTTAVLSAWNAGRFLFGPIASPRLYALTLISSTVILSTFFQQAFIPLLGRARNVEAWSTWPGHTWRSWLLIVIGLAAALLIAIPFLISKRPHPGLAREGPGSLAIWLLLNAILVFDSLAHHFSPAALLLMGTNLLGPLFAWCILGFPMKPLPITPASSKSAC